MLAGDGAGALVGVADGEAEQSLAQAGTHLDGRPIADEVVGHEARVGFHVPVVESARGPLHAFAKDPLALPHVEVVSLALLDPARAQSLGGDTHSSGAKNTGAAIMMQPIRSSRASTRSARRTRSRQSPGPDRAA